MLPRRSSHHPLASVLLMQSASIYPQHWLRSQVQQDKTNADGGGQETVGRALERMPSSAFNAGLDDLPMQQSMYASAQDLSDSDSTDQSSRRSSPTGDSTDLGGQMALLSSLKAQLRAKQYAREQKKIDALRGLTPDEFASANQASSDPVPPSSPSSSESEGSSADHSADGLKSQLAVLEALKTQLRQKQEGRKKAEALAKTMATNARVTLFL